MINQHKSCLRIFPILIFVVIYQTQQIEERQRRNIQKSRPYFEEKQLCQEQLQTQKERIQELQLQIQATKASYATSLKNLEQISEEIHKTRGHMPITPTGPREPGVGAELCTDDGDGSQTGDPTNCSAYFSSSLKHPIKDLNNLPISELMAQYENDMSLETVSLGTTSMLSEDKDDDDDDDRMGDMSIMGMPGCSSRLSGKITNSPTEPLNVGDLSDQPCGESDVEELRLRVKVLAARPLDGGGDGQTKDCWESELNDAVNKLDRLMMVKESTKPAATTTTIPSIATNATNTTKTFLNNSIQVMQQKMEELLPVTQQTSAAMMQNMPSMKELPLLSRISNEISANTANTVKVLKRRLSLN